MSALWKGQDSDKVLSVSLFDLFPVEKASPESEYVLGDNQTVAALGSAPGTIFYHKPTESFHVSCANGSLLGISALQFEGKKRVSAKDFFNGYKIQSGVSRFE